MNHRIIKCNYGFKGQKNHAVSVNLLIVFIFIKCLFMIYFVYRSSRKYVIFYIHTLKWILLKYIWIMKLIIKKKLQFFYFRQYCKTYKQCTTTFGVSVTLFLIYLSTSFMNSTKFQGLSGTFWPFPHSVYWKWYAIFSSPCEINSTIQNCFKNTRFQCSIGLNNEIILHVSTKSNLIIRTFKC